MTNDETQGFADVKDRLDEIVDAVSDESISLDAALDLYEEAVKLGMKVSSLLEEDIAAEQITEAVKDLDAVQVQDQDQALEQEPDREQEQDQDQALEQEPDRDQEQDPHREQDREQPAGEGESHE